MSYIFEYGYEIQKDSNGVVSLKNYDYVPTWVYKYTDEKNKTKYKSKENREKVLT